MTGPLAGSLYFTRDQPGIWASEVDLHVPRIDLAPAPGDTTGVTITTPHPMEGCRHYIVRHKLLDARFRLLSQKTFDLERDQPVSRHALPAGYIGPVYAVSICNLHDAWIEGAMVGQPAQAPGF
jgi:superoxide reductase